MKTAFLFPALLLAPACTSTAPSVDPGGASAASAPAAGGTSERASAPARPATARSGAFQPIAGEDVLYSWSGGLDALFVDPKDAGVREALRQLGPRLSELAAEGPVTGEDLALVATLFLGPGSFSLGAVQAPDADFPVRGQLEFRAPSAAEARARADALARMLNRLEMPSLGIDEALGLSRLDVGMFEVVHGVARAGRPDTLVIAANGLSTAERDHGSLDLPAGAVPALVYRLDYAAMREMLATFAGPEATQALDLFGIGNVQIQGAIAHGPDRCHTAVRTIGWVPVARQTGVLAEGTIPRDVLKRIPVDATLAFVARWDAGGLVETMRKAAELDEEAAGVDPLFLLRELTGVDLEADLLDHLGSTFGAYASDATGGGGHFSWSAFAEVEDEAGLRAGLGRLEALLENHAAEQGVTGLTVRRSQHRGTEIATFAARGWPIPIEPSWAIQDGWLVAGLSVQGVRAALDQVRSGRSSLLDHEGFRAGAPGPVDGNVQITFLDVARFARDGYPMAVMLGAALSNGVSSEGGPERAAPGLVPAFADFVRGARATVAFGRIEGNDLVVRGQADRSLLVQMAGIAGAVGPLPLALIAAGVASEQEVQAEEPFLFEFDAEEMDGIDELDGMDFDEHGEVHDGGHSHSVEIRPVPVEEPK
ncbi:MAG: hypothetical protein JNK02_17240 [Planctomycetes bacterium]|nr:hypothetical protein [Planctomycetota bacterium]